MNLKDELAQHAGTLRTCARGQGTLHVDEVEWQLNAIADELDELAAALGEGFPNALQGIALARLIRGFDPNGTATTTVRKAAPSDALPDGYITAQVAELSEPERTPFTCGIAPDGSSSS